MNATTLSESTSEAILAPAQQAGSTAVLRTWLKKTGDPVVKDEPVAELETDKVVVEVFAPCDGVLQVLVQEDSPAPPDAVLGRVAAQRAQLSQTRQAAPHAQDTSATSTSTSRVTGSPADTALTADVQAPYDLRLSPAVRRLVAEHNLDPARIQGTGRGGRLTREDVVKVIEAQTHIHTEARKDSPGTHIPHTPMRRHIAQHMQASLGTAPHVTAVFEADFSAILRHRQQHKAHFAQQGVNLTLTAYFISAAASAMTAVPQVNSRWHADSLEIFPDIHIGIGTALGDQGLIVPVIHQVQSLSLLGIASRLQTLTQAARQGTLKPEDVRNGTFTISNYGVSGALVASPIIIHQPQSAILGIGAIQKRVVVNEVQGADSLQIRPMAYVSLTIDHRVLNGDQANAWLARFVETLETWE